MDVCRSNLELRTLSWGYAAWQYSLITPATTGFRRTDCRSDTSRTGCVSMSGGPLLPGLMRPVAVIVDHVLAQHQGQVALAENQGPVQKFAALGPDDALADGVHPGRLDRPGNFRGIFLPT